MSNWLRNYYFTRAAVSASWVALTFGVAPSAPQITAPLLVAYPAWDALANLADAKRNGGLAQNKSQAFNLAVSAAAAVGVGIALGSGLNAVLGVFGAWAALAGLFQLVTGVRRWRIEGAQWAMILSGGQSALAGAFFIKQATGADLPDLSPLAGYASFGAFYFLVSAISLTISAYRRGKTA